METKLNQLLADFVVEYHKLQTFHWYVKGKDFFTVHAKLEEYYDHVREYWWGGRTYFNVKYETIGLSPRIFKSIFNHRSTRRVCCSQDILTEVSKDFEYLLRGKRIKKICGWSGAVCNFCSYGQLYFTLYKSSLDAQTAVCIMKSHK